MKNHGPTLDPGDSIQCLMELADGITPRIMFPTMIQSNQPPWTTEKTASVRLAFKVEPPMKEDYTLCPWVYWTSKGYYKPTPIHKKCATSSTLDYTSVEENYLDNLKQMLSNKTAFSLSQFLDFY